MHISTVTLPEMKLAGLPLAGPLSVLETDMPEIWKAFLEREQELGETNGFRYGVSLQESAGVHIECVAAEVADLNNLPPGMIGIRIPARRYAMLTHRGPMARAQATYVTGFAAIEQLGMAHDTDAWRLERYDRRYTPTVHDVTRTDNAYDILIPLYG
ncbi:GyrI-like domain-containing protein [Massilia niastensis]|uniref:GyrI-like domain-containing protein n=1 Tax=Massilia niastensis TaxID=544911 RepID=UPI0003A36463|nr:GyrI-like domain-containing protein [Massilia niastensis]